MTFAATIDAIVAIVGTIALWTVVMAMVAPGGVRYVFDRVMDHRRDRLAKKHERRMAQLDLDIVKRITDDEMREAA